MRWFLFCLFVLSSFNVQAFKVAVPAYLQSYLKTLSSDYQNDLSQLIFDDQQKLGLVLFLQVYHDQEIEWVFVDQKQKAQELLYKGDVVASLFLEELNESKDSLSVHYLISSPIIEVDQWVNGLFKCNESSTIQSIVLLKSDESLTSNINAAFENIEIDFENSWPALMSRCKEYGAAMQLPLALMDQKILGNEIFFTGEYLKLPFSYHIVFSAQNSKSQKIKELFERRLVDFVLPAQRK